MKKNILWTSLFALLLFLPLASFSAEKVAGILVKGNLKIETDAIKAKIGTAVGEPLSIEQVRQDIKRIHEMGYFDDINY